MKFYINGLQTRTEISIIIPVGFLPVLVKDSTLHGWHFTAQMSLPKRGSRKFSEVDFREFFFLCPVSRARQGKVGREIPATDQRNQGEEPPIGGAE